MRGRHVQAGHVFAAIEATEETILNSLFSAETMVGRDGYVRHALPIEETVAIMRRHGRGPFNKEKRSPPLRHALIASSAQTPAQEGSVKLRRGAS